MRSISSLLASIPTSTTSALSPDRYTVSETEGENDSTVIKMGDGQSWAWTAKAITSGHTSGGFQAQGVKGRGIHKFTAKVQGEREAECKRHGARCGWSGEGRSFRPRLSGFDRPQQRLPWLAMSNTLPSACCAACLPADYTLHPAHDDGYRHGHWSNYITSKSIKCQSSSAIQAVGRARLISLRGLRALALVSCKSGHLTRLCSEELHLLLKHSSVSRHRWALGTPSKCSLLRR